MPVHTKKERKLKGIKKSSSGKIRKRQKGGKALRRGDLESLLSQSGGVGRLGSNVGIARGETPGDIPAELQGLSPEQLAQIDRFAQGAIFSETNPLGIAGLPVGIGIAGINELSKLAPGVQNFIADG